MPQRMLYKKGGKQKIHGQMLNTCVVDESEVAQLVAEGWSKTTTFDQVDEKPVTVVSPAIQEALIICAKGLGLTDDTKDSTSEELANLIIESGATVSDLSEDEKPEPEKELEEKDSTVNDEKSDRELLEDRARALGVEFRSNIHDDTLLERVEEAEKHAADLDTE